MMNVILSSRCPSKYLMLVLNTRKGSQHSRCVLLHHPYEIASFSLCVPKLKIECKGLSFQRNSGPTLAVVVGWWLVMTIKKIEKLTFRGVRAV